jgi:hypothetical protein
VNPNFKNAQGRSLLLMPVPASEIFISNKDDVEDDFREDKRRPELVLRDSLYLGMISNAEDNVRPGVTVEWMDSTEFISLRNPSNNVFLQFSEDEIDTAHTYFVPKKEWLIAHGQTPDLILSITKINFGRNQNFMPGTYMPGHTVSTPHGSFTVGGGFIGGGSTSSLDAEFEFIIFDYQNNTWVSHGKGVASSHFLFAMTRSDWDNVFRSIVSWAVFECPALQKPLDY